MSEPHPMRVVINEKYVLLSVVPSVKSACIYVYSDGLVMLEVSQDFGHGLQEFTRGYTTVDKAKAAFARRFAPEWRKEK